MNKQNVVGVIFFAILALSAYFFLYVKGGSKPPTPGPDVIKHGQMR